jgi:hypothetical protein
VPASDGFCLPVLARMWHGRARRNSYEGTMTHQWSGPSFWRAERRQHALPRKAAGAAIADFALVSMGAAMDLYSYPPAPSLRWSRTFAPLVRQGCNPTPRAHPEGGGSVRVDF